MGDALRLPFVARKIDMTFQKKCVLSDETIQQLLEFADAAPLKRAFAKCAVRHMHATCCKRLREEFELLDWEHQGRIPVERLVAQLQRSPLVPEGRAKSV